MIVHPGLRALRGDDAPQRHAQAALQTALAEWRDREMADVASELERFAAGARLGECGALAALFRPGARAFAPVTGFVSAMVGALGRSPLGHVPLRHFTDGVTSTLLLARAQGATLALVAVDGTGLAARPAASTVDFAPTETWEHVLAGRGEGERIVARTEPGDGVTLERDAIDLAPGRVFARNGRREALRVRRAAGALVWLRLQRRRADGEPAREYALADGRLVHQAAGDPAESRTELAIALLGRMQRTDAAMPIARIAQSPGSASLRWQALRECLALDTGKGFRALSQVADAAGDPLAGAAAALRARLVEAYPQLREVEPCPA